MKRKRTPVLLEERLDFILERKAAPANAELLPVLDEAAALILGTDPDQRPPCRRGGPGGLVGLKNGGYYIIVPDLHGRMDFFRAILNWEGFSGQSVLEDLEADLARIICVGDAFHSESRGRNRWYKAIEEWSSGYRSSPNMDEEMKENLGLLEMLCLVKKEFPDRFHFLKGNHENVANEEGEGNFPFRKYAFEGDMVKSWLQKFRGQDLLDSIYRWEKALPLMAKGPGFLVTHAEPAKALGPEQVINAYESADIIRSLTWTDNDQAAADSVSETLLRFGMTDPRSRIFGGHRPVRDGLCSLRQNGRYVQINSPVNWIAAAFSDIRDFSPERNIFVLNKE